MTHDRLYRNASLKADVHWQELCATYSIHTSWTKKAKLRLIRKLNAIYYWKCSHT